MKVYLENNITTEQSQAFLQFIEGISDSISLSRYFHEAIPEEELERINKDIKDALLAEDYDRRERFDNEIEYREKILGICGTEEKACIYFDGLLRQDMEAVDSFQTFEDDEPYQTDRIDFIGKIFTRETFVTRGPLFEVCYFEMKETWKETKQQLRSLYTFPIMIDEIKFEDLAFYQAGQLKCAICSHENYGYMELSDKEFQAFRKLGIEYEVEE